MSNPRHGRKDNQHSGHLKKESGQSPKVTEGQAMSGSSAASLLAGQPRPKPEGVGLGTLLISQLIPMTEFFR
jgi:hypothetical protein